MTRLTLAAAALLLTTISSLSWAQSAADADHEKHHPQQQNAAPSPAQPAAPAGPQGTQGMMGDGMVKMMDVMPMAGIMRMMMGMMRPDGTESIDHVEGHIAFLRTELKITDAQSRTWDAFADTLRANAKSLGEVRASMMPKVGAAPPSLVDRLTLQEKWLAARLEGTRAIKSALTNLAGTFSDEQKKAADELLAPHMGMMAMMAGMQLAHMNAGQMPPGMMTQGQGR
jgi:hypothetical protein